jgi:16S rRNA (adenine1518-N6/adenine1519-N6)-dimethyltransferase
MQFLKKSLGQNFLQDRNVIKKIINLIEIKNNNIIEIGPGMGSLTDEILMKNPKSLIIIEKDNSLAKKLKNKYNLIKSVKIINEDILKLNIDKFSKKNSIVFGNLPYNISSQILVKFLRISNIPKKFKHVIFMFQKEVGDKISGKFKSSNYSRLSILTGYKFKIQKKFLVSPNCFFPRPKVNSMVIHFRPINKLNSNIQNILNLEKVTNTLFSNKRKMINKNIKKLLKFDQITKLKELKLNLRPSEVSPEMYFKITEMFEEK